MTTDPNDKAPQYQETDTPGVYITDVVPTISDTPATDDGIWYDDMTPEQKIEYGIFPTERPS